MKKVRLEPSDWRFSAAIVGLIKYLNYSECNYELTEEYIEFEPAEVTKERYLIFAEEYFSTKMYHRKILDLLNKDNLTEEEIKAVNENLKGNTIMKKVFQKIKFTGENKEEIINLIEENRFSIIEETFVNGNSMYTNYCNTSSFFKEEKKACRVLGYYLDAPRKSKEASYGMNNKTFQSTDSRYFDFIPFAFTKTYTNVFINFSSDLKELIRVNSLIENENKLYSIFSKIEKTTEIILKNRNNDYFKTKFLRKKAIEIFDMITTNKKIADVVSKTIKIKYYNSFSDNSGYIILDEVVSKSILDNLRIDSLILYLLREENMSYNVSKLIKINRKLSLEDPEEEVYKIALKELYLIGAILKNGNILNPEIKKLIYNVFYQNKKETIENIFNIIEKAGKPLHCLPDLYENFEKNKNLLYFITKILKAIEEGGVKNGK